MANLIIKPTSGGSLILQDEGGDAALTVGTTGSTTLAGTANNLGTASGTLTLNSGSVLNHDAGKYAWHRYASSVVDVSSAAVLDFDSVVYQGSRTTESAGTITVLDAGLYWVSYAISANSYGGTDIDFNLRINNTMVNGTRLYVNPVTSAIEYPSNTGSWAVRLSANDTIHMYGTGKYYGTPTDSMTYCSGFRIGATS